MKIDKSKIAILQSKTKKGRKKKTYSIKESLNGSLEDTLILI